LRTLRRLLETFLIPDFPLGALLIVILFGVGLLLAFPEVPLAWAWEIVVAVSVVIWAAGAGLLANSRPPETTRHEQHKEGRQDIHGAHTADFAALINTIAAQGHANREEERREDRGKEFREFTTIILLAATVVGIFRQIDEMQRVYRPISDQAAATAEQAQASKRAVVGSQEQIVAEQRAWIGSPNASLVGHTVGQSIKVDFNYVNYGRSPAGIAMNIAGHLFEKGDWYSPYGYGVRALLAIKDFCMGGDDFFANSVAFPVTGAGIYTGHYGISDSNIPDQQTLTYDQSVDKGDRVFVLTGCALYKAGLATKHTSFCYYYKGDQNEDPNRLYICPVGNAAD
jgi:hypothetical protein